MDVEVGCARGVGLDGRGFGERGKGDVWEGDCSLRDELELEAVFPSPSILSSRNC